MDNDAEATVCLSDQGLTEIPEDVLLKCTYITVLNISGNPGIQLHGYLRRFTYLRKLVLNNCALKRIPEELFELTELQELHLEGNNFANGVTSSIGRLVQLKKLDLRGCSLKGLPYSIFELEQLEELLLGNLDDLVLRKRNNFSEGVSPAIGRLIRLKKLHIGNCRISTLPDSIGDLKQLEELELGYNNFPGGLTHAIGRFVRLRKLNLTSCGLTDVPDSIGDLEQLEELDLGWNNFNGGLPHSFARLVRLQKLVLRYCYLTSVPDSIGALEQLTELDLQNNNIHDYPLCTLRLKNLRTLNLSNAKCSNKVNRNCIKRLPMELAYTSLHVLELYENPTTEPPREIWEQGIKAIKSFMQALRPGGALMHADTLNMIGDTGAGKTSVAQSLVARSPRSTDKADRTRVMQQLRLTINERLGHSVNINDFGGHEIYHSVMPIFLPANGLVILVFSLNDENQEEKVTKWLLTVFAKCAEVRVIIVGTHFDQVVGKRSDLEAKMHGWKSKILKSATEEVEDHLIHLTPSDVQVESKLRRLQQLLENLRKADISVVALSCLKTEKERSNEGLSELFNFVADSLRPLQKLPNRWCQVMNDILNNEALYITMKQVDDICKAHFTDADDSEARATILRYLSRTSQIIWLENHESLGDVIFQSPLKIIDLCKCILDHDGASLDKLKHHYGKAVKEYENGFLTEPLMKKMLQSQAENEGPRGLPNKELFNVVCNFLQEFNLTSCVTEDNRGKKYIIPCKLSSFPPKQLTDFKIKESMCSNRVVVQLSFIGSMIPLSFFETSLSSILTVAGETAEHYIWKDGLIIFREEVCFMAKRLDPIITLSAFSDSNDKSPWTLLHPMLKRLHDNVTWSWHGAPPDCVILCPCCLRRIQNEDDEQNVGQIQSDLMTLAAASGSGAEKKKCKKCTERDLLSVCLPEEKIDRKRPAISSNEPSSSKHNKLSEPGTSRSASVLQQTLRRMIPELHEALLIDQVQNLADYIYSQDKLSQSEWKTICNETDPLRARNSLISYVQAGGDSAIQCFAEALHYNKKHDLANKLCLNGQTDHHHAAAHS